MSKRKALQADNFSRTSAHPAPRRSSRSRHTDDRHVNDVQVASDISSQEGRGGAPTNDTDLVRSQGKRRRGEGQTLTRRQIRLERAMDEAAQLRKEERSRGQQRGLSPRLTTSEADPHIRPESRLDIHRETGSEGPSLRKMEMSSSRKQRREESSLAQHQSFQDRRASGAQTDSLATPQRRSSTGPDGRAGVGSGAISQGSVSRRSDRVSVYRGSEGRVARGAESTRETTNTAITQDAASEAQRMLLPKHSGASDARGESRESHEQSRMRESSHVHGRRRALAERTQQSERTHRHAQIPSGLTGASDSGPLEQSKKVEGKPPASTTVSSVREAKKRETTLAPVSTAARPLASQRSNEADLSSGVTRITSSSARRSSRPGPSGAETTREGHREQHPHTSRTSLTKPDASDQVKLSKAARPHAGSRDALHDDSHNAFALHGASTKAQVTGQEISRTEESTSLTGESFSTSVLSRSEISEVLEQGARLSRTERRKREQAVAAVSAELVAEASSGAPAFGSWKWALHGLAAGVVTLAVVSIPFLMSQGSAALASQNFAGSFVGGQAATSADTPAALSADPNAAVKSTAESASREGAAQTCTTQNSAAGVRAAFSPEVDSSNTVVMPLAEGSYRYTSAFGYRVDPIYGGTSMHAGQDMAAPLNTPIYAVADGVVTHAGKGIEGRSNNVIVVKHEIRGKTYYSWYVHMYDSGVLVKEGDKVTAGQRIGLVGSNGNSTGPHLHLEIHDANNALLNPLDWLNENNAIFVSRLCN